MSRLASSSQIPVNVSIVAFDLAAGEDIFLTYAHGREHGPGIMRTGKGSPSMLHLYPEQPGEITTNPDGLRLRSWLVREEMRKADASWGGTRFAAVSSVQDRRTLQSYVSENARLASHDEEFVRVYPNHQIVGQQGCGDLTMNLWNVAYINSPLAYLSRPTLIYLHDEPIASRTYSCLVKWRDPSLPDRISIEDLRFDPNALPPNNMVWKRRSSGWVTCGNDIEFAVSNQQVIRNGQIVDISRLTQEFSDLRHLVRLPNLNPNLPLPLISGRGRPLRVNLDAGRPRRYFGRDQGDDIWFGEAQLINDINLQRAAMIGPVFLSRTYDGLGASLDQVRSAMGLSPGGWYREVTDPRIPLRRGQYRVVPYDDTQIEVFLWRNKYPWSMIGMHQNGQEILCLACQADLGRYIGLTLEDAARCLQAAGARDALLIDEGQDVFQAALINAVGPVATVASGPPDLVVTIPLGQNRGPRLRATFIFAKQR